MGSWVGALLVLAIVVAGAYLARKASHMDTPTAAVPVAASASSVAANTAEPLIEHPISQARSAPASASSAVSPVRDDNDASVAVALAGLAGASDLSSVLVRQQIIARIVATIDALPRRGLSTFMLPVHTPKGDFLVEDAGGAMVVSEQNAARYAPYMQIQDGVDPQALVTWYVHSYPVFQAAYRELGYPKGYFNDRLIVVIDNLLATPDLTQPPILVKSRTFYGYTDPALESLSAGQKLLIRVGPANAARIKMKLRAIRMQLTGKDLRAAPAQQGAEE